jgi:hypothetical protein
MKPSFRFANEKTYLRWHSILREVHPRRQLLNNLVRWVSTFLHLFERATTISEKYPTRTRPNQKVVTLETGAEAESILQIGNGRQQLQGRI